MIFNRFIFVILWTLICRTSTASTSTAGPSEEFLLRESIRLYKYVQLIKTIDFEEALESVAGLMNMLRMIFPFRFGKIEQKMFDMYDPGTGRTFGVAFRALMNMMRVKSNRDQLHAMFRELTVPETSAAVGDARPSKVGPPAEGRGRVVAPARQWTAVPISSPAEEAPETSAAAPTVSSSAAAAALAALKRRPMPSKAAPLPAPRRAAAERLIPIRADDDDDDEAGADESNVAVTPAKAIGAAAGSAVTRGDVDPSRPARPPARNASAVTEAAADVADEHSAETDARVVRLKTLLDRVKKSGTASPGMQARAALVSKILAERGMSALTTSDGKIRLPRSVTVTA